jgi:hypothetical protein
LAIYDIKSNNNYSLETNYGYNIHMWIQFEEFCQAQSNHQFAQLSDLNPTSVTDLWAEMVVGFNLTEKTLETQNKKNISNLFNFVKGHLLRWNNSC